MADGLRSPEAALAQMLDGVEPLAAERVEVGGALGRVTAGPVASLLTLPPWDNSAMDGFAVRAADVAAASPSTPVTLRVTGEAAAGHVAGSSVQPGTALRILTGAALPDGADAVVPVEETDAPQGVAGLPATVAIHRAVAAGAHVRSAGSDLVAGRPILGPGTALTPAMVGLLVAAGHGTVAVHRQPRVAILSTGDELVPAGEPIGDRGIPDSNAAALAAQAIEVGAEPVALGIAPDDRPTIVSRLREGIAAADVVVVSGGVSVGAHDEVKAAFEELGGIGLWRIAIQPGKPLAFGHATAPDGRRVLLFGLPGNPVSSYVTFELFVRPVLRRLAGLSGSGRGTVRARLAETVTKSPGRRAYLRVVLEPAADDGLPSARLAGGQGSHVLSALAAADGLAIIPEDVDGLPSGSLTDVIRIAKEPAR